LAELFARYSAYRCHVISDRSLCFKAAAPLDSLWLNSRTRQINVCFRIRLFPPMARTPAYWKLLKMAAGRWLSSRFPESNAAIAATFTCFAIVTGRSLAPARRHCVPAPQPSVLSLCARGRHSCQDAHQPLQDHPLIVLRSPRTSPCSLTITCARFQ
jgi:hypothetical protein